MRTTDSLLYSAEKRVVLLYVGAKLKGIDQDRRAIASNLVCAAIKGMTPTFFGKGDCYSAQDLIDVACKFLYRRMERFLYDNGKIKQVAFEKCSDPRHEKTVLFYVLEEVLDFEHFEDVDVGDVGCALLANEEHLQESSYCISMLTSDTGDGFQCQKLIEKAVRDYQNTCT